MTQFSITTNGLENLKGFETLDQRINFAAVKTVNKGARDGRAKSARLIREQVAFPKSYLHPSGGRLVVAQKAQGKRLTAIIRARHRPTSLARFITSRGRGGVSVEVAPGRTRFLRRAFPIKLQRGTASVDTQFNLGLAIRLRPGERLTRKIRQVQGGRGLTYLYGPSVQQVFLDDSGKGVARDIEPGLLRDMELEFLRLLKL